MYVIKKFMIFSRFKYLRNTTGIPPRIALTKSKAEFLLKKYIK